MLLKGAVMSRFCFLFYQGGTLDYEPTPLDGMNVWDTISNGEPSPRKEILLNIDLNPDEKHDLSAITKYEGIAFRQGDMKLLMSVDNASWYKPPELGGKPDMRLHKVGYYSLYIGG